MSSSHPNTVGAAHALIANTVRNCMLKSCMCLKVGIKLAKPTAILKKVCIYFTVIMHPFNVIGAHAHKGYGGLCVVCVCVCGCVCVCVCGCVCVCNSLFIEVATWQACLTTITGQG